MKENRQDNSILISPLNNEEFNQPLRTVAGINDNSIKDCSSSLKCLSKDFFLSANKTFPYWIDFISLLFFLIINNP